MCIVNVVVIGGGRDEVYVVLFIWVWVLDGGRSVSVV